MPLERPDAFTALWTTWAHVVLLRGLQLPHSYCAIQTARNELSAAGGERHTVNTVFVSWISALLFKSLQQVACLHLPDTHALVKTSSSQETVVRRNSDSRDAIFNSEDLDTLVVLNVPKAHGTVSGTRGDVSSIRGIVEGIDVLLMAPEFVPDLAGIDFPDLWRSVNIDTRLRVKTRILTRITLSSAPVAKKIPSGLKHTLRM